MDRQTESAHGDSAHAAAPAPPGEPLTVFPFPPPVATRPATDTVINPERRGSSATPPIGADPELSGSSLWPRLFPPEGAGPEAPGPAGARLEHFVIEERIGVGGMGAVFRAVDQRLQRVVALKVLSPALSRDPGAVQRFQNEARAAARLDHDNIARVHYIGADRGLHFIAFEYVTGTNLRDLIQRHGRLPAAEALNYALQVATALVHTSAAGVVHRDIKPSNIIITPSGRAKLVDLGLARKQNSESVGELTMAGTTLGTFDYISPEQAKDPRNVDVRSDIYSLGCTMYHMLTGEPPYPEGTVLQKLLDHQGKEPPDAAAKNPAVPPEFSAVIRRMMASEPRRRFASAEDLLRHLLPIAGGMGLRGLHPEGLVWVKPPSLRLRFWERHLGWMATAALLVVLVLLVDRWPFRGAGGAPAAPNGPFAAAPEPREPLPRRSNDERGDELAHGRSADPALTAADTGTSSRPGPRADDTDVPGLDDSPGRAASGASLDESPDFEDLVPDGREPGSLRLPFEGGRPLADDFANRYADTVPPVASRARTTDAASAAESHGSAASRPSAAEHGVEPDAGGSQAASGAPSTGAPPAAPQRPFYVITEGRESARPTLEAACTDAKSGSTIELRYDGRLDAFERPFRIANKSLTIRAGTKPGGERYRPLVEFAADPLSDPGQTRMISLVDAAIELVNVDLALVADANLRLAEDQWWSLFALAGNETLKIQHATITLVNPGRQPAALIEIAAGAASDLPGMMEMMSTMGTAPAPQFGVDITRSVVRGAGDLFVSRQGRAGSFEISQSLIAVDGSLLLATGTVDASEKQREIELELSHVTCLVGQSLIRMDSGSLPRQQLPVHVSSARNNIFAAADPGVPLIWMTGNTPSDEFRRLFRWSGVHNVYDGFASYWLVESTQDLTIGEPDDFDTWRRFWGSRGTSTGEIDAAQAGLLWKRAWRTVDFASLTSADVVLDDTASDNPALGAATDGDDAGADLSQLPPVSRPADPSVP